MLDGAIPLIRTCSSDLISQFLVVRSVLIATSRILPSLL